MRRLVKTTCGSNCRWRISLALKKAGVELDRKILANVAVKDPDGFKSLAEQAKGAIGGAA